MAALVDENQPLLGASEDLARRQDEDDALHGAIDFDPSGDPENPLEWPSAFKWGIVALMAFMAFTVTFTCISLVPVANRIAFDLNHGHENKEASVLLVTIWELGEAAGPLLIAPLSEVFGRYPVMNVANCLFIAAIILAALSQSTWLFVAARCLNGVAVASNVLNPAIVGDMFVSEQRGSPMSFIMIAPLIGGAVGPAIAGAIAQSLGWRQILWMSALLATVCEVLFLTCFRETYKVPILRRRAARFAEETGDESLKAAANTGDHRSVSKLWQSIKRPVSVISGSIVLALLALYGGVGFSFFYFMAVTLPDILEGLYGLSPAATGSAFMCFSVGSLLAIFLCEKTLDGIYVKLKDANNGKGQPEFRLPLMIVGAFTLPLAVAGYGWIAELRLPLPLLLVSVGFMGFTLLLAFLPLMAYVVDAFGLYSASALTSVIVIRCLCGTFLPLGSGPAIDAFGYGWGLTLFSAGALCLAPIPIVIFRYGPRLRQLSSYTRDV
ncbi:major facilitator superfamily transporter [Coniochaeta ligniaria NRRL 30616]|uniref:Major facilitator superfamily transporter n=1 Tax=Coniochaeta ligniaria NRRL 30616 TaxID=1408157 RepID=A0A1J7J4S7_9PEZI|nr:major facilitator superfamily transporter [Coniochaeta ligniaria NRRL 30616]